MAFAIRSYHPSDLIALYRICLLTGDSGKDASRLYRDPDLLGHYYAAPYAVCEPDLCFVLTNDGRPCGYILGTRDTPAFWQWCDSHWFPVLRQRYPLPPDDDRSPDAQIIRSIQRRPSLNSDLQAYPAHLHIDILPEGQGQGFGRRLMQTFLDRLRALNVCAVHLGVGKQNTGAIAFYERVGFHHVLDHPWGITFGMHLAAS